MIVLVVYNAIEMKKYIPNNLFHSIIIAIAIASCILSGIYAKKNCKMNCSGTKSTGYTLNLYNGSPFYIDPDYCSAKKQLCISNYPVNYIFNVSNIFANRDDLKNRNLPYRCSFYNTYYMIDIRITRMDSYRSRRIFMQDRPLYLQNSALLC